MATSLITQLPTFVFSSQLREIEFATDLDRLVIKLTDSTTDVFSTTIYAYDGKASLINIAEVIESYMIANDRVFTPFTLYYLTAGGLILNSFNINTVYCSHYTDDNAGLVGSYNFLSAMASRRVPRGCIEFFTIFHGQDSGTLNLHCRYASADGSIGICTLPFKEITTDDIGALTIPIAYSEIVLLLEDFDTYFDRLLSFTVEFNNRFCTCYVTDNVPNIAFSFKNCFNVYETIYLNAVTTTKTKVNRSMAISQGRHSFYDQSVDKTYEVETAPLTEAEADWVEQLFVSHSVRLGSATDPDSLPKVIITESTCEIDDNDEQLKRVKFTWLFVEQRPHLQSKFNTSESGIFTEPFNHSFN